MKSGPFIFLITLTLFIFFHCSDQSDRATAPDSLAQGFILPANEARPNVMWWWLNSNISEEGITRDLEEMKKQGIGGALIFDAAPVDRWKPKDVEPAPIGPPFMSERWRELFRHAIKEADRLGLELGVSITSGFNAGGPWVTPEYGQQELVWSEIEIDQSIEQPIRLPLPSGQVYGDQGERLAYNEMEINNNLARDTDGNPVYYKDIAILAFPLTAATPRSASTKPTLQTQAGRLKNWALKSVHSFDYPEERGFKFDVVYEDWDNFTDEAKISKSEIINLTHLLGENGLLSWQIPPGKWKICRFGHTYTGIRLQATNPQNEGLAMDHLSKEAARRHFDEIGSKMIEDISAVNGQNLVYFYLDSWEVRIANWTPGFQEEFQERRGYDMTPYLPVLTGIIIDSRDISNRFLHDYRMTIGDCIADNYYGAFSNLCHQNGLEFRAEMATTPIPVNMLKCLGRVDIPFGEFWTETDLPDGRIEPWQRMFGKQAASAAHIYGSRYAAAEALTVIQKHWEHSPYQLKKTVDQAFSSGLNKLMIHTFTHSPPAERAPGYEYFAGTHFNPQITWWDQAHAFTGYISRCQYLLQQGHFIADVCFYQGDQIPAFVTMKQPQPGLGSGYDYDIINTEVLVERMSVENGLLMLPDGMCYRLLVLPDTKMINPLVLEKIADLVKEGATVIGRKPVSAYGLENYPQSDSLIKNLAGQIWGNGDSETGQEKAFGQGKIISGNTARQVLIDDGILPDFEYQNRQEASEIDFIHRRLSNGDLNTDIYFVVNSRERWEEIDGTFRIDDRRPEIWQAETGEITDQIIYYRKDGRVTLPLRLSPLGSVFIVFRKPADSIYINKIIRDNTPVFPGGGNSVPPVPDIDIVDLERNKLLIETWMAGDYAIGLSDGRTIHHNSVGMPASIMIDQPWKIEFPSGWGAPDSINLSDLISWTKSNIPGIKYFSGTARYQTDFYMENALLKKDTQYYLDLGLVKDLAEIVINGQLLPILWKPPFREDITPWIKSGRNRLEIKITNLWPNRLIGDQWLPKEKRYTFTNIGKFTKKSPLFESGLLGPVQIYRVPQEIIAY